MAQPHISKASKLRTVNLWVTFTILGVIIYAAIDIVVTFLRPDYSWLHNAESDYGRGPYFWLMDINFLLRCFLSLTLVRAIFIKFSNNKPIKQASVLIMVWAAASGLLAFFADNPYDYPKLASGSVHLVLALVAFIAAVLAMIMFNRLAPLARVSRTNTYVLTLIAIASLILLGHAGFRPNSFGGLYERIFLASVLVWEVVVASFIQTDDKRPNGT